MEMITISGHLYSDCETKTDKKGYNFLRFVVACDSRNKNNEPVVVLYRCYSYNTQYANMKKGCEVFLSGSFKLNVVAGQVNLEIFVQNMTVAKSFSETK